MRPVFFLFSISILPNFAPLKPTLPIFAAKMVSLLWPNFAEFCPTLPPIGIVEIVDIRVLFSK